MDPQAPPDVTVPDGHFTVGYLPHLLLLAALLPTPLALSAGVLDDGVFLGLSDRAWLWIAIAVPVVHQVEVAVFWRLQLRYRLLSRIAGRRDLALWGAMFLPLLFARPLTLLGLGLADAGSAQLPAAVAIGLAVLLGVPAVVTLYSV